MAERREPRFGRDYDAEERAERRAAGDSRRERKPSRRKRRRRGSVLGGLFRTVLLLAIWGGVAGAAVVAYEAAKLPPIDQIAVPKRPPNIAILASDGTLIASRGDTGGAAVKLKDLPPYLPQAFVAIEDRRFYHHFGIDPIGILRAIVSDLVLHRGMQGGSTLTQQLAKNLFLTQERTLQRKIQEAILAVWLEHKFSKQQILDLYLNRVYFGSGAFGVEAAAHKYFNTDARNVSVAQAAMLAGLMKAPTKLAPNRNLAAAVERAAQVIAAMREEHYITDAQAQTALADPAHVVRAPGTGSINYAADYVVDTLDDAIGAVDEDIVVQTTIDRKLQADGEAALTDELNKKGGKYGVREGALVAMDPDGAIRVLIGGRDYAASQFDRAVAAKRQPGSAFKPFVYLAAMEKGLTPDTVREDAPINVHGWHPENYSREYFGPVTLTRALSLSLNTVAVRLCLEVGPKAAIAVAHRLGITSDLQPNASIALGTSEVSPLEMVTAYTPFANGGIGVQPHVIARIKTSGGRLLYQRRAANNGQVIDPHNVAMMNTMMTQTLLTGTARKGELPGWQAGGKTGTSQEYRDAWFIGYTSRLVTGVWLGNDDDSPTKRASGGTLPVEIWSRFMKQAMAGQQPVGLPYGTAHGTPAIAPPSSDGPKLFGIPLPGFGRSAPVAAAVPAPAPRHPDAYDYQPRATPAAVPQRPAADQNASAAASPADGPSDAARPQHRPQSGTLLDRIFGTAL